MSFTVPPRSLWLRWNAILCAVAIFIWSTPEEDRPIFAAGLGIWLALSLFAKSIWDRLSSFDRGG